LFNSWYLSAKQRVLADGGLVAALLKHPDSMIDTGVEAFRVFETQDGSQEESQGTSGIVSNVYE
jgi:hypothetical protein